MIKNYFVRLKRKDPKTIKGLIFVLIIIASILLAFLLGLWLGSYLRGKQITPIKVNLGGLEQSMIQAPELRSKIKWGKEIYIYDLRKKEEYDGGHIRKAISMPIKDVIGRIGEIPREKEVVLYCQNYSCEEASEAVMILDAAKYKNFRVLFGGVEEWTGQGNKLVK